MENKQEKSLKRFGLIGRNIDYSFSRTYFSEKFQKEKITNSSYENFDLDSVELFPSIIQNTSNLKGLNVTIPYKESIIPFLDKLNKTAKKIGAVNTIKISKKGKLVGYNTDAFGFKNALKPHLKFQHKRALILGTGGASKAIAFSLKQLGIRYKFVSRKATNKKHLTYNELSKEIIQKHKLIINCTPLGTFPNINEAPKIPYEYISEKHLLFDLIYNPIETTFLKLGKQQGAKTLNGLDMLIKQAEKAWKIWNKK